MGIPPYRQSTKTQNRHVYARLRAYYNIGITSPKTETASPTAARTAAPAPGVGDPKSEKRPIFTMDRSFLFGVPVRSSVIVGKVAKVAKVNSCCQSRESR